MNARQREAGEALADERQQKSPTKDVASPAKAPAPDAECLDRIQKAHIPKT